jgi:hypothetical protein
MSAPAGRRRARAWVLASLASGVCACASIADRSQPIQYLDPNTGATFKIVAKPLIFDRKRPQLAARVRDYATVAAGYVDRSGRIDYVLLIYLWSTVDPRNEDGGAATSSADLALAADDRLIPLRPMDDPAQAAPPIDQPPVRHFTARIYRTDPATLRYLAAVRHLALLRGGGRDQARFELWDDERGFLTALVDSEGRDFP